MGSAIEGWIRGGRGARSGSKGAGNCLITVIARLYFPVKSASLRLAQDLEPKFPLPGTLGSARVPRFSWELMLPRVHRPCCTFARNLSRLRCTGAMRRRL